MNALDVFCAQLTRDLFAIAKFLLTIGRLLLHCWYSLGRPVTIGTPMVIFYFFNCLLTILVHCWYTVGTVLVDMWRLVHQWSFLLFWLSFDCSWLFLTMSTLLVDLWRLVTNGHFCCCDCLSTVFWVFLTIGTPLVHCWYSFGRPVTISTPMVCFWRLVQCTIRQKQSKDGQNSKNHQIHEAAQTPLPCKTSITRHSLSPVGRADCMCLHGRPCVWLPFAAACCYTLFYLYWKLFESYL